MNRYCLFLAGVLILHAAATWAQAPAAGRGRPGLPPPQADSVKFMVFPLQNADAEETAVVLRSLLVDASRPGREHVVADPRTNAVFVRASGKALEQVEEFLKLLDQPQEAAETKVFQLENIVADAKLQSVLLALTGDEETKIAVEPATNTVLACGSPQTLAAIEALLLRLDEAPAPAPEAPEVQQPDEDMQVRLVWLVAGDLVDAAPPPPDLKNVVQELETMGISGLKTVTQAFVKTLEEKQFQVNGTASAELPYHLEISGAFRRKRSDGEADQAGLFLLEIAIRAWDPDRNAALANLQTTITAPEGHSIVLGMAPMGEMTSVFVVQLRK